MKLVIDELCKNFSTRAGVTRALGPVSFEVGSGEFVSLLGPSGCGKSTSLYIIAGLEKASSGRVLLDGQAVPNPGPDRGMVFQHYTLFPWLTVRENVRYSLTLGCNNNPAQSTSDVLEPYNRADCLLDIMGLEAFKNSYPRELSGGMKQRVAIARALVSRPKVLLMDEPFGALDAQTREEMQELLLLLAQHEKTTILFVTHDIEEALFLSTRILVYSARPARILQDIRPPFPQERTMEIKLDPEFLRLKREIVTLLRHEEGTGTSRAELLEKLTRSKH